MRAYERTQLAVLLISGVVAALSLVLLGYLLGRP